MIKRLFSTCLILIAGSTSLILIAGLSFYGCQDRKIDKKTGMDVVEKPWPVWTVTFSPDGRWLAAGLGYRSNAKFWKGGKGEVSVWKVKDWKLEGGFSAPFTIYVQALGFTPDSKHLVAAATQYIQKSKPDRRSPPRVEGHQFEGEPNPHDGNAIFVWAVPGGSLEHSHHFAAREDSHRRGSGFVSSLDIHPSGELIGLPGVGGLPGAGGASIVLERKTGRLAYEVGGDNGLWQSLAFSPDGKALAFVLKPSVTRGGGTLASVQAPLVQLCDASTGKKLADFEPKFKNPARPRYGKRGYELVGDRPVCVCYTGDGKQIAVGVTNGSVLLLSSDLTKQLRSLQISSDKEWVVGLASAPKTGLLAAATPSCVRLFEASSGKQLQEWGKADLKASTVALSPDGKLLAVGYGGKHDAKGERRGGYVNIWDTSTGRLVKKLD